MNTIVLVLISLSFFQYRECFFPNDFPRAFFADLLFTNYDGENSKSHLEMSKRAIFDFIIETLESMDSSKQPVHMPEIIEKLQDFNTRFSNRYKSVDNYVYKFKDTIKEIMDSNEETDLNKDTINNPIFHFDAELLQKTNDRLIKQKNEIISDLKLDEYEKARLKIGQYFHTLQDFYSHSNWVEMNNADINYDIGERRLDGKIAQKEEATCVNCEILTSQNDEISEWERIIDYEYNCEKNMISSLNEQKILTSGYFSGQILDGEPVSKPESKCSHGGFFDKTRKIEPYGGINKDGSVKFFSPHYYLHQKAATLATKASKNFLKSIQSEIGIEKSLCIFNIHCSKNVVFLIDATGSMELDIGAAKLNALRIFRKLENELDKKIFSLNATIAYFNDFLFLNFFTNISNITKFNQMLSLIDAKQPDPIQTPICIYTPILYCYCCRYDYSNKDFGREVINSRIIYSLEVVSKASDIFLFTDALASDTMTENEVISFLKLENVRFSCAFCPRIAQRSLVPSSYQNYVQLSGGSYENNGDLIIPELSLNQQLYSVFILSNESFFGQIYIDSFVKNLTIDVKTTGSYSIDDLELADNSQNFLKLGNVYLNFNLSEKFTLNIYGLNDFLISYRFYEYVENSSHPGFRYFDQALSDSEIGVSFTFSDEVNLNLTQLSLLDYDTDNEISNATLDWFNERFDANILVPNRKSYFLIKGIDSNGLLFQRYLKQIPFEPVYYSIDFERDLTITNNSINKYNVIVKSSNKYLSTIDLKLSSVKNDLFSLNISPRQINISNQEFAIFSSEFYFKEEMESFEINIAILPIIIVNNSNTIYLEKKTINLNYVKDESLKNRTELEAPTSVNSYEVTTSYFENSSFLNLITEENTSFITQLENQNNSSLSNHMTTADLLNNSFSSSTNIQNFTQMTNSTKIIDDNATLRSLLNKIINFIVWFINYIIAF